LVVVSKGLVDLMYTARCFFLELLAAEFDHLLSRFYWAIGRAVDDPSSKSPLLNFYRAVVA